ncbi:MAG: hypothetical protein JWP97_360 [Labilithrix sp.]|nr:hypothetical protein [Labilithrix sp.]
MLVQIVGVLTLLRSVALDRWVTVLASLVLLAGATAARRNRSWGVLLALAAASAFPVAFLIGIAPPWFMLVGLVGARPFLLSSRAFARFDKGAAALLAGLAVSFGAAGAVLWKEVVWPVFLEHPMLWPSRYPHHGVWLLPLLAVAIVAMRVRPGRSGSLVTEAEARVRVDDAALLPGVRIGDDAHEAGEHEALQELERELGDDGASASHERRRAELARR